MPGSVGRRLEPLMIVSSGILIPEARAERRIRLQMPITVVAGD